MSLQDPIADMLTRINNAQRAGHLLVAMRTSAIKRNIASVLASEGYIESFADEGEGVSQLLVIKLKYYREKPVISEMKRISRPGLRVYRGVSDIPRVYNDLGITILSTNQGVMTGRAARKVRVGGEVLCSVF